MVQLKKQPASLRELQRLRKMRRVLDMMLDADQDYTVTEICEDIGISRTTYYKWTKGELGELLHDVYPIEKIIEGARKSLLDAIGPATKRFLKIAKGKTPTLDLPIRLRHSSISPSL